MIESWLSIAPEVFFLACLLTLVAAMVQGIIGFGFSILCVPTLALIDPVLAPLPQLFLVFPLAFGMYLRERHEADLGGVVAILVGRIPGAVLGLGLLKWASGQSLDYILGGMVLFAVLVLTLGYSVPRNTVTQFFAGVVSGIFSLVSAIGGPPVALIYHEEKGPRVRASLAAVASVGSLLSIGTRSVAGELGWSDLFLALSLMPSMILGFLLSGKLKKSLEGEAFKKGTLVLAGAAGLSVIVKAYLR